MDARGLGAGVDRHLEPHRGVLGADYDGVIPVAFVIRAQNGPMRFEVPVDAGAEPARIHGAVTVAPASPGSRSTA
ncbi:MAG: hypothetical protein AAF684_08720, partial [Pseudomonadota bacterium]